MRRLKNLCKKIDGLTIGRGNNMNEEILKVMREAGKPLTAGEVAKVLGVDKADVDKAFTLLKKSNDIVSPVRCKWEPAVK